MFCKKLENKFVALAPTVILYHCQAQFLLDLFGNNDSDANINKRFCQKYLANVPNKNDFANFISNFMMEKKKFNIIRQPLIIAKYC